MSITVRHAALAPFWAAQLLTGAKSFGDNPIIGNPALNARGLHVGRLRLAHGLAWQRRSRLAARLPAEHRAAFDRDGFVEVRDFLAAGHFHALREQARACRGPAREMVCRATPSRVACRSIPRRWRASRRRPNCWACARGATWSATPAATTRSP